MGRIVRGEERQPAAGSGQGAVMHGLARSLVDDREPSGNRGILDLLQADQTGDQRLREHRLRRSRSQEPRAGEQRGEVVRHTVERAPLRTQSFMESYFPDPVAQQLQELIDQELNRQINEHVNREIERQMQEQFQRYIDQEMDQQILQQVMAVRGL